jgi:hypothetical protein
MAYKCQENLKLLRVNLRIPSPTFKKDVEMLIYHRKLVLMRFEK